MKKAWLVYPNYKDDEEDEEWGDEHPEFHLKEPGRWTLGRVVEIVYAVIEEEED